MRIAAALLGCVLPALPALAVAADGDGDGDGDGGTPLPAKPQDAPIIGGGNAMDGKWPDVAAILFRSGLGGDVTLCTGTLVAPTVVLTAGHCYDPNDPPLPHAVLIGTSSLGRPSAGETIEIQRGFVFPDAENTEDLAVLVLARPSTRTPRRIATGWARIEIVNGAPVTLVGFGAIDRDGQDYIDELQEASSVITDFDCSQSPGCNELARPAGELGAGGMGVDTCPGDSGGPLYLMTDHGALLAGVTSRSYDGALFACSDGGIYERPDKVVDWIEATAGVPIARGPEPEADPIVASLGDGGETRIDVNDPRSDSHSFEITSPPAHGIARVRGDGAVRVCIDPAAAPGDDELTVTITDSQAQRAVPITIQIQIRDGTAPATPCDVDAFDTGGCCDAGGGSGSSILLAIGVLALLQRRRR